MTTVELIAALLKRGYGPSPIGCPAVLRGNAASWAELNPDPMLPAPVMGERYFYWPDHEWPADDEDGIYADAVRLVDACPRV